jgi:hypothetical protein
VPAEGPHQLTAVSVNSEVLTFKVAPVEFRVNRLIGSASHEKGSLLRRRSLLGYTKSPRRPEIDSAIPAPESNKIQWFAFPSNHPGIGNEFLREPQTGQKVTAVVQRAKYTGTNRISQ